MNIRDVKAADLQKAPRSQQRTPFFGCISRSSASFARCRHVFETITSRHGLAGEVVEAHNCCICCDGRSESAAGTAWHVGLLPQSLEAAELVSELDAVAEGHARPRFGSYLVLSLHSGQVLLATDIHGSIPLYHCFVDEAFWFSSELGLLVERLGTAEVDPFSVVESMYKYRTAPPASLFRDIAYLGGASAADVDLATARVDVRKYFRFGSLIDADAYRAGLRRSVPDLEGELSRRLDEAVAASVQNINTAGIFLSGGVDSSLLTAMAVPHVDVHAVHVELPGESNEVAFATAVAKTLGLDLEIVRCDRESFLRHLVDTVHFLERPFFVPNTVGLVQAALSDKFSGADVILDGELADSPFYSSGIDPNLLRKQHLHQNFGLPVKAIDTIETVLKRVNRYFGLKISDGPAFGGVDREVFARRFEDAIFLKREKARLDHVASDFERSLIAQTLYAQEGGSQHLIARVDAAARAAGLHAILPYAHPQYLGFVLNLPSKFKVRGTGPLRLLTEPKWLLKRLAAKRLPHEAIWRKKVGFGLPVGQYLTNFPDSFKKDSFFQSYFRMDRALFEKYVLEKTGSNDMHFILCFEIWGRMFCRGENRADLQVGALT